MKEMTQQSKRIFDLLQADGGFLNPLTTPVNQLNSSVSTAKGHMDFLNSYIDPLSTVRQQLDAAGLTTSYCNSFKSKLDSIVPVNTNLIKYSDSCVEEFSRRIQVARSYIEIMVSATRPFQGNPYQMVMGVTTQEGLTRVETLKASLDSTNTKLQALKTAIQGSSTNISSQATAAKVEIDKTNSEISVYTSIVPNLISSEEKLYLLYIKTATDGYLAVSLPKWDATPEITGVVDAVATPQLKALL